ncbi:MAG: AI-2E family transporter [Oscillospiraceae bacterium]|nr:AI-2E family transporter [Oscillospiraceae bacterium]
MRKWKEHKYFNLGAMLLCVGTISLVLLAIVLNLDAVGQMFKTIQRVISPMLVGLVLAYLMNPLMNFMEKRLYPLLLKKKVPETKAKRRSRVASLSFALLVMLVLVYEFCALLLPQLYESIVGIVNNFSNYYVTIEGWITDFLADKPEIQSYVNRLISEAFAFLKNWANDGLLPGIETVLTGLTTSIVTVVRALLNVLIGVFAAIYMLYSRDIFLAQSKKVIVALFTEQTSDRILGIGRRIHKVFSGFIIGKILDSLIIGLLCYFGMLILKLPYPELIATVVGVTNVIPFFGPFIGAIPSAFLILLVNPLQALYFVIFVLVLQQLDGNVIGPRILGDTIGISGFWVLVSITVAGGLFGFTGMVLGVPVFAVAYTLLADFVSYKLKGKQKPLQTKAYQTIQKVEDLNETETDA